jgi:nucleosome assembly protein 1-like 1
LLQIRELERKYQSRFQPLYETRAAIVQGKKEPTGDEGILPSDDEDEQNDSEDDEGAGTSNGGQCLVGSPL